MFASLAIQHGETIPLGVVGDLNNLLLQLLELQVQVTALSIVIGVIDCLDGQLTHALHHVRDFVGRALGGLDQGDRVTCIANRLIQTANLVRHACGNGHASCIVPGGVDPLTGRQLLHRN